MFRQRQFILSSAILGLVVFISLISATIPGKAPVKEVAGIKQSVTITPTNVSNEKSASTAAKKQLKGITPTITKTPATSTTTSNGSESSQHTSSSSTNNPNTPNTPSSSIPTITNSPTNSAADNQISPTVSPTDTPISNSTLTISGNTCSNVIGAICPTPTPPKVGASSGNTVTIQFATPTPSNTGGDVRVTTGSLISPTP